LEAQVQDQQAIINNLQAALAVSRSELEVAQSAVFELTAREEQAVSGASTAELLASEEIDRLAAQLRESRKEKALLQRQLQQQQQQQQQQQGDLQGLQSAQDSLGQSADTESQQMQQQQQQRSSDADVAAAAAAAQDALESPEEVTREFQHQVRTL
jgi:hypothetical protein